MLQTPEAAQLVATSTRHAGATSDWRPEDLATHPKVKQMLSDFAAGGDARRTLVAFARRRLVQTLNPARLGLLDPSLAAGTSFKQPLRQSPPWSPPPPPPMPP